MRKLNEVVNRKWGYYSVLNEGAGDRCRWKLKRLIINPNSKSSLQRHFKRSETWFYPQSNTDTFIAQGEWHQLINVSNEPLEIIEFQFGEECLEEDIERKEE